MSTLKFPKELSVKIERDSDKSQWFNALPGADVMKHAEQGEKTKVGIYQLKEILEVEGTVSTRRIS